MKCCVIIKGNAINLETYNFKSSQNIYEKKYEIVPGKKENMKRIPKFKKKKTFWRDEGILD